MEVTCYILENFFLVNNCWILQQIPLSSISEDVYKTSVDWIGKRSSEALGSFVLWSLDSIFADFASHQAASKGSKKAVQPASSKSQVAFQLVDHYSFMTYYVGCGKGCYSF